MDWNDQLRAFELRQVQTAQGRVSYRCGADPALARAVGDGLLPLVLLHGIGSASASWVAQLAGLSPSRLVLAWDAPGYGASQALAQSMPRARDYAERLWDWLDALQLKGPVSLAGHSLGALMAAGAARLAPRRVANLVLLAPAQGYARSDAATRAGKLADRLAKLRQLGPQGLAESRAAAMLSDQAPPGMLAFIRQVMAGIEPAGYTQASHMLDGGDILEDLQALDLPLRVASGSADIITPAKGCQALASAVGATYLDLGAVGHACPLEAARAVNALLQHQGMPSEATRP